MAIFRSGERLKSLKEIELVFEKGQSLSHAPLRLLWMNLPEEGDKEEVKIAFSVPKKIFKKAVVRNRIKRRMREAYRLNKAKMPGLAPKEKLRIFMIYTHNQELPYKEIEDALIILFNKLLIAREKTVK